LILTNFPQHPVQVVTDILLCHGKSRAFNQAFNLLLGTAELQIARAVFNIGEITRGERRQGKAAASALDNNALLLLKKLDIGAIRKGSADIYQLTCRNSYLTTLPCLLQLYAPYNLHFQICAGQRQLITIQDQQHIRQYWQGLTALYHTGNQL